MQRLGRLLAIRDLQAMRDRRAFQLAAGALAEVDAALVREHAHAVEAVGAGAMALAAGDRTEWLLTDARREVGRSNQAQLAGMRVERERAVAPAAEQMAVSRMEQEQVKILLRAARSDEAVRNERRVQAAADDWFLSQRARAARRSGMKPLS